VRTLSRDDGFTLTELLVATTVMLLVMGGALTTVRNAVMINDSAAQMADANQNLRAGTNTLIRDLLMAGRIIGSEGISMPGGIVFKRPGPPGTVLTFDLIASSDPTDPTLQMPAITTGYHLGPTIRNSQTDIVTILTIDEFMPVVTTPPQNPSSPAGNEGTIAPDATYVTFPANSQWINGDTSIDTPKMEVGDLVYFKSQYGNAIQTITKIDSTKIYFENNGTADFFGFNATTPTTGTNRPLSAVKQVGTALTWPPPPVGGGVGVLCAAPGVTMTATSNFCSPVTLFKLNMITYYVDNTNSTTPRLTRQLNNNCTGCSAKFSPQALAGIVEDLDLTYDVYDGSCNPTEVPFDRTAAWTTTCGSPSATIAYTENLIRKVNVHVGVRSETMSKPLQDYVRGHITTSVNVRSLTAVDRYNSISQ
jgi:prepilin-type N-terminal cleavage/methylation domain-containing protein